MRWLIPCVISLCGCAGPCFQQDSDIFFSEVCQQERIQDRLDLEKWARIGRALNPKTYGLPDHTQHLGQSALQPAFGNSIGGDYGNSYVQTPNAYGPGIHMDQYGRAVTY